MQLETFRYHPDQGWSQPFPTALDSEETLVLVFGAPSYLDTPEPISQLRDHFRGSHFIGCSTAGEIFETSLEDDSLVVAIVRFTETRLATAIAPVSADGQLYEAGRSIAGQLLRPDLRGVLVLSDGQGVNGSELVRGLNSMLPPEVIVTGGLAGDGARFQRTWVLGAVPPSSGYVVAAGLYGDHVRLGHGSMGGWDIFGPEREVTRAEGNVLYELNGRPALQLYESYLGELAAGLPASALLFPLALRLHAQDDRSVVRTVLSVDRETQSLTFAGDIPQGTLVRLMRANSDRLIEGASMAALQAREEGENAARCPTLSIAISCVGRRLVLGERAEEELESVLEALPPHTRQVGFYSYGEISPRGSGFCDLHNQTMTLTTIREEGPCPIPSSPAS